MGVDGGLESLVLSGVNHSPSDAMGDVRTPRSRGQANPAPVTVLPPFNLRQMRSELRAAVSELLDHYFVIAADWASQLLADMPADAPRRHAKTATVAGARLALSVSEVDAILRGRTKMALREYEGAAAALEGCTSPEAVVLRCYARFLLGEQLAEEIADEKNTSAAGFATDSANPFLSDLRDELREVWGMDDGVDEDGELGDVDGQGGDDLSFLGGEVFSMSLVDLSLRAQSTPTRAALQLRGQPLGTPVPELGTRWGGGPETPVAARVGSEAPRCVASRGNGYIGYLYGVVLNKLGLRVRARKALLDALQLKPLNWSCWMALAETCPGGDESLLSYIADSCPGLRSLWIYSFFEAHFLGEVGQHQRALAVYDSLLSEFPGSSYVLRKRGRVKYYMLDYDAALADFKQLLALGRHGVEDLDVCSNIMYVKQMHFELAQLAFSVANTHKFAPETCCIVGNFYALKGEHAKAITHFRRALLLNRKYVEAWILIGHEYLELRDHAPALEAYRKAVDLSPRDARAWYSLGQVYEMLQMHLYSLHYYRLAARLSPTDSRMWRALGDCYEFLRRHEEAQKCLERAEGLNSSEEQPDDSILTEGDPSFC